MNKYKSIFISDLHLGTKQAKAEELLELGIEYMNTGDWVESCTALVETFEGKWEIVRYES